MEFNDSTPSLREQLYVDIAKHILGITVNRKPVFKFIDLWNNQWQHMAEEKVVNFPCLFIEFGDIQWQQLGGKAQQGEVTISLHIGSKVPYSSAMTDGFNNAATKHLRLLDAVHAHLKTLNIDYGGSFTRISSATDHDHDNIVAHIEQYRVVVEDYSAVPITVRRTVRGEIGFKQK